MTDDELEALLRAATPIELPDDGFTERVMRHVGADRAALDAPAALAALRQREAGARRAARWRWIGAAAGVVVAALPLVVGGWPSMPQLPQLLAMVLAAGAAAWALAAPAVGES